VPLEHCDYVNFISAEKIDNSVAIEDYLAQILSVVFGYNSTRERSLRDLLTSDNKTLYPATGRIRAVLTNKGADFP
jgi:hypothetical protein